MTKKKNCTQLIVLPLQIWDSAIREAKDEVGLRRDQLEDFSCLGLTANTEEGGRPSLEFFARLSLTAAEVKELHASGNQVEADELTSLCMLPLDHSESACYDVTGEEEPRAMLKEMTSALKGALLLAHHHEMIPAERRDERPNPHLGNKVIKPADLARPRHSCSSRRDVTSPPLLLTFPWRCSSKYLEKMKVFLTLFFVALLAACGLAAPMMSSAVEDGAFTRGFRENAGLPPADDYSITIEYAFPIYSFHIPFKFAS
ncbi:hypothetical protein C7M84_014349 [Penaeus vannamei]|uniref:Uncharacterized protein n=1 Tax=Penaeus vannamei TaxID=6689 RepID=A0A3R7MQS0_PENVA|nr:hypothetical protein C7M84_014349 [Penaeus vannamei]